MHFSHTIHSGSRNSWSSIGKELEYTFFQGLKTGTMDDQLFLPRDVFSLFYVILYLNYTYNLFFSSSNYVLYDILLGATVGYF